MSHHTNALACFAFAAGILFGGVSARAASLTWNPAGASDNWNTTETNWNPGVVAWTQNSDAVFNGTAETITPTVAVTFNDLSFDLTGFTIAAGAGSLVLSDDQSSSISVVSGGTATISETIANNGAGVSSITKTGTGTLVLNGAAANTFSGGVNISAGTLSSSQSANIAVLGTGPISVASTATLNLTNTSTSADTTVSNAISGSGSITTTSGTRALNITGDLSGFTGNLTIGSSGAGKIAVSPSVAMPSGASVTINSGGTLFAVTKTFTNSFTSAGTGNTENRGAFRLDTGCLVSGNIALTANTSIGNSGSSASTISGIISGAGFGISGAVTGNQPIILSGANTFTGKATMTGGNAFSVSSINNAGNAGNLGTNGTIDFGSTTVGGTLIYTGTGETTDRVINLAGTTGGAAITQSGTGLLKFTATNTATGGGSKTLTLNGSTAGSGEISGAIVDNSATNKTSVTKDGTGTWTLSGNNSFTGNVTITTGPLVIKNGNALGTGTKTITASNGTTGNCNLRLDGSAGDITLPSTFTYTVSNQTFDGTLVNVAGNNTVPGLFNITSGGGSLLISSLGGNINVSANITSTTSGRLLLLSGNSTGTVSGVISNGSTPGMPVVKDGSGTWTLSAANTFTGTASVNAGTLNITGSLAGGAVANGGILNMVGTAAGASSANAGTFKLNYSTVDSGKISDSAILNLGGGTVEISGGTHSEKVLSTSLTAGKLSNVTRTSGATGFLKLGAVTANPGSQVVFSADNIASTTNANVNGILPWARVLVAGVPTLATNSGVSDGDGGSFITAFGGSVTVDRLGGVIPNNITNNLKIIEAGVSGNITLAASPLTAANFLEMSAPGGPAVIAPTSATDVLMIGDEAGGTIWQSSTAGALSIGATANDGVLTSGNSENGTATALTLINDSATNALTVNASIANNGTVTPDVVSLNKGGAGNVILTGNNTFTGGVNAAAGSLAMTGNNQFTGILALINAGTSVTLSGNNQARPAATNGLTSVAAGTTLQLQANAGNTISGTSYALSAEQTANQPLSLLTGSTLQLRSDSSVSFAGGNNLGGMGSATVTFDVNNLSSGTGNTIGFAPGGFAVNTTTLNITGGNGYTLGTGIINNVANSGVLTLNPTTANMSLAGYTANATFSTTLALGGSAANNLVTGAIANPATSGTTTLTKSGTSVWTLQGANTFTGNTTISAGTLAIGGSGNLAAGSYAGTIANSGALSYASSATQTLSGVISGSGTLAKSGSGSLTLSAANTYTGATTITGGTVIAQNNAALGTTAAGTTISSGGTLDLGGTLGDAALNLGAEVLTISGTGVGGAGVLVNNGSNNQINATGRIVLAGNSTIGGTKRWDLRSSTPTLDMGGFALTKTGANTVSLVGVAVSNPGSVIIDNGVFSVETGTSLGGTSANSITANTGSTLQFYANTVSIPWTVNLNGATMSQINTSTTVTGPVALANTGTNTLSVTGTSLTLSGIVSGAGGFTKSGVNLLTLSGANTYAGATSITAGRVVASHNTALGTTAGGTTVASGSQLELGNGVTIAGEPLSVSGGGTTAGTGSFRGALQATSGAAAVWDGGLTLDLTDTRVGTQANGTLTVTGAIDDGSNTFDLDISADGTNGVVILSGVSTYGGNTEIIRGTLRLGGNNRLPTTTLLDVDTANAVADAAIFDLNGFNQTVGGLTDTATTSLTGLILNSAISTTSTLTVNSAADSQFDSVIADGDGLVALTKSGSAKLTLNGANTYKGATDVQNGTLVINGNQAGANGAVSVSNGATLGGNGTLGGAVAIASGGTIAPGTSTGALAVASADFAPGGILAIEINDASTPKVDTLNATGALDITGATLALSITGTPAQSAYVIASYASGQLTGTFANVTGLPLTYKIDYNYAGGTQIALVPSEYAAWTVAKGLTPGVNDGPNDDPDGDGQTNKAEFAFDGNPLSGSTSGKIVGKIGSVGGGDYMTLTIPVRNGAVFADASGPDVSGIVNGILYRIEGSDALAAWSLNVTEVTGPDAAAIQAGLPGLSDIDADTFPDWTYRTFRAPNPVTGGNPADFLRAAAE